MKNSILSDLNYTELITLRKHFNKIRRNQIHSEFDYQKPEYIKYSNIIDQIDKIILNKFESDINTPVNYSGNVEN